MFRSFGFVPVLTTRNATTAAGGWSWPESSRPALRNDTVVTRQVAPA